MEKLRTRLARRMRELMAQNPAMDTQTKVADRSGVGQSSVQRLLAQEQSATLDMLEQLAPAFGFKRPESLILDSDEVDLLNTWGALSPTDKSAVLGYIQIALHAGREQLPLDADKPLRPGLQAKQKAAAERSASKQIQPTPNATRAAKRRKT